jgi:gamma-glutamyl:cysteine ligase YbdK (ATP-grasp superfamily)
MTSKTFSAFSGYGIELEYMIVDQKTQDVRPVADLALHDGCRETGGEICGDVDRGAFGWSNELVLHVIELKTNGPAPDLGKLASGFHGEVQAVNRLLAKHGCRLAPSAMHPWMVPDRETKLWPHDNNEIYDAYNRIFGCKGHGWSNLQSMHINLPFNGNSEFGRLHAAIRLVLPLLPAIAASSPFYEGKKGQSLDNRLEFYRKNQARVPEIAGMIVPEAVFTKAAYEQEIFAKVFKAIAPHDRDKILQHEWLNSRGAIARFDRDAIEIRLIDVQECTSADIGIAAFVISLVKALYDERHISYDAQCAWAASDLAVILDETIRSAENAKLHAKTYGRVFGIQDAATTRDLLASLIDRFLPEAPKECVRALEVIRTQGSLASRMIRAHEKQGASLPAIMTRLGDCLAENVPFEA